MLSAVNSFLSALHSAANKSVFLIGISSQLASIDPSSTQSVSRMSLIVDLIVSQGWPSPSARAVPRLIADTTPADLVETRCHPAAGPGAHHSHTRRGKVHVNKYRFSNH